MKAVIIKEKGTAELVDIKEQSMRDGYIKVRTVAVAVNPTDYLHVAGYGRVGGILGCDMYGIVEDVGPNCKSDVKKGDAVYGICHGGNMNDAEDGAFAEYAMVKDGHIAKIPTLLAFEDAATLGLGITTVGMSLYMTLKFPLPTESAKSSLPILIYGGSTATGTLAIQFAKLSTVLTTASPKNFALVKDRGADAVFDYNDPDCARKIREYTTNNSLNYVFDCISTPSSYAIIADVFPTSRAAEDLHLVVLSPLDGWTRTDVETNIILAYTSWGEPFNKFGMDFPAFPEHHEFTVMFWKLAAQLLADGKVKPRPVARRVGGLAGISAGIDEIHSGTVSGAKLVYTIADGA